MCLPRPRLRWAAVVALQYASYRSLERQPVLLQAWAVAGQARHLWVLLLPPDPLPLAMLGVLHLPRREPHVVLFVDAGEVLDLKQVRNLCKSLFSEAIN